MDDLALLRLQLEWGADEALAEEPMDRLRPPVPVAESSRPDMGMTAAAATLSRPVPVTPPPEIRKPPAEQAKLLADEADTLDALRAAIAGFDGCTLRETASHLVFAEGDPAARMMLVGEAPGADEDRAGHPFAGEEGVLLDRMLASVKLSRADFLLTPLIPWRPPGGRIPYPTELATCLPFLQRLIALVRPRRIIVVGTLAARTLMPTRGRRARATPEWEDCTVPGLESPVAALVLPSLATLIKTPASKREAWAALQLLQRTLADASTEL
jgi:DNA polymerase